MISLKKYPVYDLFEFLDSTFDVLTSRSINLSDDNDNYTITLPIPGLTKDDIEINVVDDFIVVSYNNEKTKKKQLFVQTFEKRYLLPDNSDIENITGKVENGVLLVNIPKVKTKKSKKQIVID